VSGGKFIQDVLAFEFEDQSYFPGFRALASNGIDLPVLNAFRMMAKLTGQRVAVESSADLGVEAIIRDACAARLMSQRLPV
jgi:xylan 1,4-beta-xylosidase